MKPFFPEYLDKGSSGPAAMVLQSMLLAGGYNPAVIHDGRYGEQTALGVRNLQKELGFTGSDVDGNFGPKTRLALLEAKKIDINLFVVEDFTGETVPAPTTVAA